jgi:hypothetical protein
MLECLLGSIGIKDCSTGIPESGLWLNELQGITLESIDKLVEQEQITYKKFIEELDVNASNRFSNFIHNKFRQCYQIKSKQCSDDLICANVEAFYVAYRYMMARELMNYRLFSEKWNRWSMSKDQCREMKDFFNEQLEEEALIAVQTIQVDQSTDCFRSGGGSTQWITVLP